MYRTRASFVKLLPLHSFGSLRILPFRSFSLHTCGGFSLDPFRCIIVPSCSLCCEWHLAIILRGVNYWIRLKFLLVVAIHIYSSFDRLYSIFYFCSTSISIKSVIHIMKYRCIGGYGREDAENWLLLRNILTDCRRFVRSRSIHLWIIDSSGLRFR